MSQAIQRSGHTWQQTFEYDGLNRLSWAKEQDVLSTQIDAWKRTYGYDRWGNRWVTTTGLAHSDSREPTKPTDFDTSTNRLLKAEAQYDASGNQTFFNPFTLGYDAENRNTTVTSSGNGNGSFSYDGEGRRVKKIWTPSGGTAVTTYYVYDALGRLAAEYSDQAPSSTGSSYLFTDMLGSVRAITSGDGAVTECYDYLPFGRMLSASDNGRGGCFPTIPDVQFSSSVPQKFTGKERDTETGLDYFGARYYSAPQGRFTSADPMMGSANIQKPQTWNRYAYVANNPIKYIDPLGLFLWDDSAGGTWSDAALEGERDNRRLDRRRDAARDALEFRARFRRILRSDPFLYFYLGYEGQINGVTVGVGNVSFGSGETLPGRQYIAAQNKYWMDVKITFRTGLSDDDLFVATHHEVRHEADVKKFVDFMNSQNQAQGLQMLAGLTVEDAEVSAYEASAFAARLLGKPDLTYSVGSQNFTIWRRGMAEADRAIIRNYLRTEPNYSRKLNDPFFK